MLVLAGLLLASVAAVLWNQNNWHLPGELDGVPAGIVTAGGALAPLVIVSITLMVVVVEGGSMVAEQFLKRRYQSGVEKGIADSDAEWEKWLAKKQAATEAGRPFDEPPPSERR